MAIDKLVTADFTDKGVTGLPDTPNLSAGEMQAKFDELAKDVLTPKINEVIDALSEEADARSAHETAQDNPHAVTKAQVGLGSADNTADADKPVSTAQEARILEKFSEAAAQLQQHEEDHENPHQVTAEQLGAATVEYVKDLVATAGGNSGGLPSHSMLIDRDLEDQHPILAVTGLSAQLQQAQEHQQNVQNPHGVTAEQAGAVPKERTVNGHALTADLALQPEDLGEADYVVQFGSEDEWSYRKWSSGAAECWGNLSVTADTTLLRTSGCYTTEDMYAVWPSGLFVEAPGVYGAHLMLASGWTFRWVYPEGVNTDQLVYRIVSNNSDSTAGTVFFYFKGKWK